MANYANIKATINASIKQNGNEEITGPVLNSVLNAMVNTLGAGYQYAGVATPSFNPGTPDSNVFYIASEAGTYTNFGGLIVAEGEVAILKYNGTWTKEVTGAANAAEVSQLGQEQRQIELIGNGNTFVRCNLYNFIKDMTYIITFANPNWSVAGITSTGGSKFGVERWLNGGTSAASAIVRFGFSDTIPGVLTFTADGDFDFISIGLRAAVGESVKFNISPASREAILISSPILPNISTTDKTLTISALSNVIVGGKGHIVSATQTFPYYSSTPSSIYKIVFNVATKLFRSVVYSEGLAQGEVVVGGVSVDYGANTFRSIVGIDQYTIDGASKASKCAVIAPYMSNYPNIDNNAGTITIPQYSNVICGQNRGYVVQQDKTITIYGTYTSSVYKLVFNPATGEFRSIPYNEDLAPAEWLCAVFSLDYSTHKVIVVSGGLSNYTIDGKFPNIPDDKAYLYAANNLAKAVRLRNRYGVTEDRVSIMHTSDTHYYNTNAKKNLLEAVSYANDFPVDVMLNTGDMCNGSKGRAKATTVAEISAFVTDILGANAQVLVTPGNHDNNFNATDLTTTNPNYDTIISKSEQRTLVGDAINAKFANTYQVANKMYCYYDVPNKNVRIICVDTGDTYVDNGNEIIPYFYISRAQYEWLYQVLLDTPITTHVVVACHSLDNNPKLGDYYGVAYLQQIIDAWRKGESVTINFQTDKVWGYSLSMDFSSRGVGEFVCFLIGHTHADYQIKSSRFNDQLIIITGTTSESNAATYVDLQKWMYRNGEELSNCFNMITIDPTFKRVFITHYGAYRDNFGENQKEQLVFYYDKPETWADAVVY